METSEDRKRNIRYATANAELVHKVEILQTDNDFVLSVKFDLDIVRRALCGETTTKKVGSIITISRTISPFALET